MNPSCPDFFSANHPSRRALLKVGLAGFAGLNLPSLLRASSSQEGPIPRAKHVIFLHQFGGPSHIDTFDMKPTAPAQIRGDFKPISSSVPGVTLTEHLPRFSKILHHFAQIRSVNHSVKNHNSATYYSLTGHAPPLDDIRLRDTLELYPAYAGTVAKFKPVTDPAIPSAVSFPYLLRDGSVTPGQTASFLGKEFDPFYIGQDPGSPNFRLPELSLPSDTDMVRLGDRRELLKTIDKQTDLLETAAIAQGIDRFYDRALTMLGSPSVKKAFDLSQEDAKLRDRYGRTTYGQSCLLARRLVESGVRFVTVYFSDTIGGAAGGGWDTHGDNCNRLKNRLLPITDQTVPTLIEDLDARGLLEDTLVVWMGEFGRTPRIATTQQFGPDGRDHWPKCYTVLMAGGGIKGGAIYGASDKIGAFPSLDAVSPDDIAATMYWALGIDPQAEFYDTLKRPLPIAAGKPITAIFG
jgi:hypothetical protein